MKIQLLTDDDKVISSTRLIDDSKITINIDHLNAETKKFLGSYVQALEVFILRYQEYGDTWSVPEFSDHEVKLMAMQCLVKGKRICNMLDKSNGEKEHFSAIMNNLIDMLNYGNFLFKKMEERR